MSKGRPRNEPYVILDSRKAKENYTFFDYYRTEIFDVKGGEVVLIEVITAELKWDQLEFDVYMVPAVNPQTAGCYPGGCIPAKHYRRWRCKQDLGNHVQDPNMPGIGKTDYDKSQVTLGYDKRLKRIVQFEYIDRPGHYYLASLKEDSPIIECCELPTTIQITRIPTSCVPNLSLPCCNDCP